MLLHKWMEAVTRYLRVALGDAIGSVRRFWLAAAMATLTGRRFPWGTRLINLAGSFVIRWFAVLTSGAGPLGVPQGIRLLVLIGLRCGFTPLLLLQPADPGTVAAAELVRAGGSIVGSVVLCLIFVWFGAPFGRV